MATELFQDAPAAATFAAGDIVFTEGEPGHVLYYVQQGTVVVSIQGRVVETVGPGGIVGEMALIDTKVRSATVVAKTACKLIPVDRERFLRLVGQTPDFSLEVMRVLARRLRRMDAHV